MSRILIAMFLVCISQIALAANQSTWRNWVQELRQEAVHEGISENLFDSVFDRMRAPSRKVKSLSKSQPEHRLTFQKYRKSRASNYRVLIGKRKYKKFKPLLNEVGKQYGVDPCFIVSIWGMETSYGSYMGNFPVLKSLATLAYDSKRKDFFRKQLIYALHIVNDGHVSLSDYKGEWAGASGQPQFLPSSWVDYAVDYNHDGKKDIWRTHSDVFASIANYLKQKGWQSNEPWAMKVSLPRNFDMNLEGRKIQKTVSEWSRLGVRMPDGSALPYQNLEASIVKPYGGPALLAFKNFRVIMRYNNSTYYAGSIGYMADKICGRVNPL